MPTKIDADSPLTARQREVFDVCERLATINVPAVRVVCSELGINSPNGVLCHFKALIARGLLVRVGHYERFGFGPRTKFGILAKLASLPVETLERFAEKQGVI